MSTYRKCERCDTLTTRRVCGACRFEEGRAVPPEVVAQLITEEQRRQERRDRERWRQERAEWSVRRVYGRGVDVVVLCIATSPEGVAHV